MQSQRRLISSRVGFILSSAVIIISVTIGCDRFKSAKQEESKPAAATNATPGVATAATAADRVCPNGQKAKMVTGDCAGTWSVKKAGETSSCEFTWGPKVACPSGMKSITYESACYGVTSRPITSGSVTTAGDCQKEFGAYPIPPAYSLACCAN